MWRYPMAVVVFAAAVAVLEFVDSLVGDETVAGAVATLVVLLGFAALWPVYFGLRDAPRR